jgi:hypothetical protein
MTAKQLIEAAAACVECGKEHKPRQIGEHQWSWAALDGHSYRAMIYAMANVNAVAMIDALRKLTAVR